MNKNRLKNRGNLPKFTHGKLKRYGAMNLIHSMINGSIRKNYFRMLDLFYLGRKLEKGFLEEGC